MADNKKDSSDKSSEKKSETRNQNSGQSNKSASSGKSENHSSGSGSPGGSRSSGNNNPKNWNSLDDMPDVGKQEQNGHFAQDDIDLDTKQEGSGGSGKKKGGKKVMQRASLVAAAQGASLAMKAAMFAMFKMMMQMLMGLVQAAAQAVGSLIATIMNVIGQIAAFIGVSVAVATMGVSTIVVILAVVVGAAIYDAATDASVRDEGNPCTEDYNFAYTSTPSADMEDAAHKIYSFFYKLGYTDTNIAGILGNFEVESSLDSSSMELVYDEGFCDMTTKSAANFKKYKNWAEAHEACKCKWLMAQIGRGQMTAIEWKEDDPLRPVTKYKYNLPDTEYDDSGNKYTVNDREFLVCYNCSKGQEHKCEHGYTEHHTIHNVAGDTECTEGWATPCEHGFTVKHHVPVYHDIGFRTRCLDWNFTPSNVRSPGCETGLDDAGNVRWTLPSDPNVADYDRENTANSRDPSTGNFEGFMLYDTNTNYHTVYCGIGMGQWTNGRNRRLMAFCNNHSLKWYQLEAQLAFMIAADGDSPGYVKWLKEWKEEPTPEQAAWQFTKHWEGNTTMAINERKLAAASWYVKISQWRLNNDFDEAYGQSIIDMAGATANSATNVAAGVQYESCGKYFNADNSSAAAAILSLAWPNKDMAENNGTARWRYIKDSVIGPLDGQGEGWKYKSCDRTVATAIRWSGTDDNFPAGPVVDQRNYMEASDNWQLIHWDGNRESLQPGDVLIHVGGAEHNHVVMYVGHELVKKQAEKPEYASVQAWQDAANDPATAIVDGSLCDRSPAVKKFTSSYYTPQRYQVYRCISKQGGAYTGISGDAYSGISEN